jgi:uncharacterized protein
MDMPRNAICHVEWQVTNLDIAKEFYGGMFRWKFEDMGDGYTMFSTGDDYLGGGLEVKDVVRSGESPLVYVQVDDLDDSVARAEVLGGTVVQRATPIPGHGSFAIVTDRDGNRIGLYKGTD